MRTRFGVLVFLSSLFLLTACGPGFQREVGERWTIDSFFAREGEMRMAGATLFVVQSVTNDGTAQIGIFDGGDFDGAGTSILVDARGELLAVVGDRACVYEKPYGLARGPLGVGSTWSLDNVQTCNPKDPQTITGSAKVEAREKLDTAIGSLDVVRITATRRTASKDVTYEETISSYWSERYGLEVKSTTQWTNTPSSGAATRGTQETSIGSYVAAPN